MSFVADVSDEVNEIYNYIYVSVQNQETYELYDFNVFRKDDWTAVIELPAGKYSIVAGGILNDWKNEYPIEYKNFEVSSSKKAKVDFYCGVKKTVSTTVLSGESTESASNATIYNNSSNYGTSQSVQYISSEPSDDASSSRAILYIPFAIVIGMLIWYFYRKKQASKNPEDTM